MKNYKILLISFVLLVFLIGAVSAADADNILTDDNPGAFIPDEPIIGDDDEDSNVKEIYVNDTGDDSNAGSQNSPYATIKRAVEDVTESDEAIIHIGEGTFSSDDDSSLQINLAHQYNGNANLKIIGAGADKTIIDGQSAYKFADFGWASNVTVKDITFINFKGDMGGTLHSEGQLTVENCIFKDSYATDGVGGAIASGWDYGMGAEDEGLTVSLTVKNSQFINCAVDSLEGWMECHGGGAIFVGQMQSLIENNTFINSTVSEDFGSGSAVLIWVSHGAKVINNKFINITGFTEDAGLNLAGWESFEADVINNTFINCTNPSEDYSIVYLGFCNVNLKNNTFIDSTNSAGNYYAMTGWLSNLNFTIENNQINVGNDEINNGMLMPVIVSDDNGNFIKGGDFKVKLSNGNKTCIVDYYASDKMLTFRDVPDNGIYNLSFSYNDYGNGGENAFTSDVIATVNVNATNSPIDLYVSPDGSDANEGSKNSPFATIQHAIDVGFEKSFTVVVHLLKGTYSGEGNVELVIANKGNLIIVSEEKNDAIIDGNNSNWFMTVGITKVNVENLKFINGKSTSRSLLCGYNLYLKDCIVDSNEATEYVIEQAVFDNLTYTNNKGTIYYLDPINKKIISNSYFANNNCSNNNYGVLNLDCEALVENCTFINNSAKNGAAITAQKSFTSRNNYYEGNTAPDSATISVDEYSPHDYVFENDTFVNNKATSGNGGVVGIEFKQADRIPMFYFTDCKFINNSAIGGGALAITNGDIRDSKFINNSADKGGAILARPYYDVSDEANNKAINFANVSFEGNVANENGQDIYLESKSSSYYCDLVTLNFSCNDLNVSTYSDTLTINVSAPCGAVIGGGIVDFKLNGTKVGSAEIMNGVASFVYSGFEDGVYTFSSQSVYGVDSTFNNGTIVVKLEGIVDDIAFWVSNGGNDETGNGSEINPFKSISHAVVEATKASRNIVINIMEGTYVGDLNTALELSSMYNLTLVGAGIDKTVIDGENDAYFAIITDGQNVVTVSNMTIKNMLPDNRKSLTVGSKAPITINDGGNLLLKGVEMIDNHGGNAIIVNNGNLAIDNSVFIRNGVTTYGIISGDSYKGNVTINNSLFEDNYAISSIISGENILINNSEIKNAYTINNMLNAYQLSFDLINHNSGSKGNVTVENTKISNDGSVEDLNALGVNTDGKYINPALAINGNLNMVNSSMINNYNGTLNTDGQVAALAYLSVLGYAYGPSRDINVYNSTFINYQYIWVSNSGLHNFTFDGCLFKNFENIAYSRNYNPDSVYDFTNSVFLNCTGLIKTQHYTTQQIPTSLNFNDNYWGNNSQPTIYFLGNRGIDERVYTPDTWIILTSEDEQTVIKNLTDGENITAYTGNAPIRTDYADNNGALDYAVVFGPVGYLFTTDDDKNVIFNESEAMIPFEAADPMDYRTPSVIAIIGFTGDLGIVGILVDPVGNPIANATISSIVGGENVANVTTDEDGAFTVKGIKNGVLTILFNGTVDYFDTEYNLTFANAGKTTKSFINLDTVESNLAIRGTLVDDEGNPIANATITYAVNGANATEVTTDDNGVFTVQGASDSIISIDFNGNDAFDASNINITLKNLSPVRQATLFNSSDFTQYALEYSAGERGQNFTTQLVDQMGNPLVNKTVLIGYNGKTLERVTNETGHVSVQINLRDANRLTFAVAFLGDEDYNATMSVYLITINKKPVTITAAAKTYKATAKTKKYTVTLKTIKGSSADGKTYFAAGKKVTMKINGKTYTAKTNAKGQATFSLKITKKGKFTAKVSYTGDNTYKEANKSVKLTIK